jgi:hypothetical protein
MPFVHSQSSSDGSGASVFTFEATTPGGSGTFQTLSATLHVPSAQPPSPSCVRLTITKSFGGFTEEELRGIEAVGRAAYLTGPAPAGR